MKFEKYSKQQFESCGLNTSDARKLADELQDDVIEEIHGAILAAFQNVVQMKKSAPEIYPTVTKRLKNNAICGLLAT